MYFWRYLTVFKTNAPLHLRAREEETGLMDHCSALAPSRNLRDLLESFLPPLLPLNLVVPLARPVLHAFLLSRGPLRPLLFSVNEFVVRKQKWCRLRSSLERRREGMRSVYHCLYSAASAVLLATVGPSFITCHLEDF